MSYSQANETLIVKESNEYEEDNRIYLISKLSTDYNIFFILIYIILHQRIVIIFPSHRSSGKFSSLNMNKIESYNP